MSSQVTPVKKPVPLPFIYTFGAGAVAGLTELIIMYPLDVVKTRQQLNVGKGGDGIWKTLTNIVREEGPGRLYRGIVPPMFMEAPKRAIKFGANGFWGNVLTDNGRRKNTQGLAIATGFLAGTVESLVVVPFELVKIRLQSKGSTFKGPLDVMRHSYQTHGIFGLYQGMESAFWRQSMWNAGYFGTIFGVKGLLPVPRTKVEGTYNNLIAGTIGGFIATTINTPFDVIKSRIQLQRSGDWSYPGLYRIARNEGWGALYKGFLPKVLRLAPGGGVMLLVVEALSTVARNHLGPPYI